jgi:GntR family transcriptional regulator
VIPFRVTLEAGMPVHQQVVFAAKKAILSGKLRPGEPFPSVRAISRAVRIHANTAQKAIAELQREGLIEVRPGIGTVVAQRLPAGRAERARVLARDAEQLAVEAMKLGASLEELQEIVAFHWNRVQPACGEES